MSSLTVLRKCGRSFWLHHCFNWCNHNNWSESHQGSATFQYSSH